MGRRKLTSFFDSRFYSALLNRILSKKVTEPQLAENERRANQTFSSFGAPDKFLSKSDQYRLSHFTTSGHPQIVKGFLTPTKETNPQSASFLEILHSAPEQHRPQKPLTVFTGISALKAETIRRSIVSHPFSSIEMHAPTSTSASIVEALPFSASISTDSPFEKNNRVKLILSMHLPKLTPGVSTHGVSLTPHEMEIVLPPGQFIPEAINFVHKDNANNEAYMISGAFTPHNPNAVHARLRSMGHSTEI